MSYSQFTLPDIKKKFQLAIHSHTSLFFPVQETPVSDYLATTLKNCAPLALAINTEKARSEWIIAPILAAWKQLFQHKISLFSGIELNVDPEQGLNGVCDFIISRSPEQYYLTAPVIIIVEAEREYQRRPGAVHGGHGSGPNFQPTSKERHPDRIGCLD